MVGRAGRAGHAAAGESFLIGRGAGGGKEWQQVCALLTAPIPCLISRVLAPDAAALFGEAHSLHPPAACALPACAGSAPAAEHMPCWHSHAHPTSPSIQTPTAANKEVPEEATRHLQQLLLEGVANGSVARGADVERLVCSTFAAHQQARRWGNCSATGRFKCPCCPMRAHLTACLCLHACRAGR